MLSLSLKMSFKLGIRNREVKMYYFLSLSIVPACLFKQPLTNLREKLQVEKPEIYVHACTSRRKDNVLVLRLRLKIKEKDRLKKILVSAFLRPNMKFFWAWVLTRKKFRSFKNLKLGLGFSLLSQSKIYKILACTQIGGGPLSLLMWIPITTPT